MDDPVMDIIQVPDLPPVRGWMAGSDPTRFVDVTLQVAGFMFDDVGSCITSFRWIPQTQTLNTSTKVTATAGGDVLHCAVPARSVPFVRNARTKETISVLLVLGVGPGETEVRYDLGDYTLREWNTSEGIVLQRVGSTPPATTGIALRMEDDVSFPTPSTSVMIQDQYHQLLVHWGVDVIMRGVTFSLPGNDFVAGAFQPTAMLFDITGDAVHTWCGTSNRFGRNVLLVVEDAYPSRVRFAQLRSLARGLRFPILLGYRVCDTASFCNLLFRPGDGISHCAHFAWDELRLHTAIVLGDSEHSVEREDHGPNSMESNGIK